MINDFEYVTENFNEIIRERFEQLCEIVTEVTSGKAQARLWAKLPSFYVEDRFVRIIPFKDHINIEAIAIAANSDCFTGYKITQKGMVQIYNDQPIPKEAIKIVFKESLLVSLDKL